jgi:DNA processing protein
VSDLAFWIGIADSPIPPIDVVRFYRDFGSVEGLWTAPEAYLKDMGLSTQTVNRFIRYRATTKVSDLEEVLSRAQSEGLSVIRFVDKEYPEQLRMIQGRPPKAPPLVLFCRGRLPDSKRGVAVVGTRECSERGRLMSRDVASALAKAGYMIVSGLARGIDTEAHTGALGAMGSTIAVLAWMTPVYPPENKMLSDQIAQSGAVISERYTVPAAQDSRRLFVERNRITSGISDALVIIESSNTGGTVWQFDFAREQRIPVFILRPQSKNSKFTQGYRYFLQKGGQSFDTADDLLNLMKDLQSRIDRYIPGA